jgi:hypothetical protein
MFWMAVLGPMRGGTYSEGQGDLFVAWKERRHAMLVGSRMGSFVLDKHIQNAEKNGHLSYSNVPVSREDRQSSDSEIVLSCEDRQSVDSGVQNNPVERQTCRRFKRSRSSTGTFILHPCSIKVVSANRTPLAYACNDQFLDLALYGRSSSAEQPHVRTPPGCIGEGLDLPSHISGHRQLALAWAHKKGLRAVASHGHAVACGRTRAVLLVDFVFERRGKSYLACVLPKCSDSTVQYARDYMQSVQKICNTDMNFFPAVLVMCMCCPGRLCVKDVSLKNRSDSL